MDARLFSTRARARARPPFPPSPRPSSPQILPTDSARLTSALAIPAPRPSPEIPPMSVPHDFGRHAERLAALVLERAGWHVLATNWRAGHRELDIVARRNELVAFVEVKARSGGNGFGHPLDAITAAKRRELATAARAWIARFGRNGDVYRFDAIAVTAVNDGSTRVEHVPDAWRPDP
jgi:putative endonuclease